MSASDPTVATSSNPRTKRIERDIGILPFPVAEQPHEAVR
jgi:hypothetical protein